MDVREIRSALLEDLGAHLAPVPLMDLEVAPDVDHDGDPILRVRAVYDERVGTPDKDKVFTSYGLVRGRIESLGEGRYPILTFISRGDRDAAAA